MFLKNKPNRLLGLDLNASQVRLLELSQEKNDYQIESFATIKLPLQAIIEKEIKNIPAVANAIAQAYAKAGAQSKYVATALPASMILAKTCAFPSELTESALYEAVQIEASRLASVPLTELALDYALLGLHPKEKHKVEVLIVTARDKQVKARMEAIRQAGLRPFIIDAECYVQARIYDFIAKQLPSIRAQTVALLDLNHQFSTITILHKLSPIYSREEYYNHPSAENLSLRMTFLQRSLQLFSTTQPHAQVEQILLFGDYPELNSLNTHISQQLALPCNILNPFIYMNPPSSFEPTHRTQYLTCCGLALRGLS